ncbi:MAG: hypothetical protein PVF08_07285 [Gammaproteobacteria bacterium]|jgi:hypothetical protein
MNNHKENRNMNSLLARKNPLHGSGRLAGTVLVAVFALLLTAPGAEARPNLTAKFGQKLTALNPLPRQWCTLSVIVENRGDRSFDNDFLVKVRAKNGNYLWNNVRGFSGIRGGDCGPVNNGVNCWLKPIPARSSVGFYFDIYPRYSGAEALIIYVDTTNAVRESHEANTFVTALTVGRGNICPRGN